MDIFAEDSRHLLDAPNMECTSVEAQAEKTKRENNNNKIQEASFKIEMKNSTVPTGNSNVTDDTAMSGLDYSVDTIANNSNGVLDSEPRLSTQFGQTPQQQANMTRLLQSTMRSLRSNTDKTLDKVATGGTKPRSNYPSGNPVNKPRQRNSEEGTMDNNAYHMERRVNDDIRKLAKARKAGKAARANADKVGFSGNNSKRRQWQTRASGINVESAAKVAETNTAETQKGLGGSDPKKWQTASEQEYQARAADIRARNLRDGNALISALDGLSLVAPKDESDEEDLITF